MRNEWKKQWKQSPCAVVYLSVIYIILKSSSDVFFLLFLVWSLSLRLKNYMCLFPFWNRCGRMSFDFCGHFFIKELNCRVTRRHSFTIMFVIDRLLCAYRFCIDTLHCAWKKAKRDLLLWLSLDAQLREIYLIWERGVWVIVVGICFFFFLFIFFVFIVTYTFNLYGRYTTVHWQWKNTNWLWVHFPISLSFKFKWDEQHTHTNRTIGRKINKNPVYRAICIVCCYPLCDRISWAAWKLSI